MIFIYGGAYQGKLAYALDRFGLGEGDVYACGEDTAMPHGKKLIYELDKWILALIRAGADPEPEIREFIQRNGDAIVICNDITGGVVPVEASLRAWREAAGKSMTELSRHASEVVRLFCGVPTRIK